MDAFGKPIDYFGRPVTPAPPDPEPELTPWNSQTGGFNDGSFRSVAAMEVDNTGVIERAVEPSLTGGANGWLGAASGSLPYVHGRENTPFTVDFGDFILTGPTAAAQEVGR